LPKPPEQPVAEIEVDAMNPMSAFDQRPPDVLEEE
jgi:hypothetical protein